MTKNEVKSYTFTLTTEEKTKLLDAANVLIEFLYSMGNDTVYIDRDWFYEPGDIEETIHVLTNLGNADILETD